jgi:hypothetical protein
LASFLGLDWDNNQLHLVAATTGRGGVRVERAVVWQDDFSPKAGRAEAVGQRLREHLRNEKIAAAPALICVGRDRVILKEIRHPVVPPVEEAALIRFQAAKEMAEPPDSVVIDYTHKTNGNGGGATEKTALAFAVRRELPLFLQAVCRTAGLKLLAVAPRGFGVASALKRAASPAPADPDAVFAVLTVAGSWADFSVVRGDSVLFTRSLPVSANLVPEVRRNLAVYAGHPSAAGARVQALHVAAGANDAPLVEDLRQALPLPVHALDPFAPDADLVFPGDRGGFTGAVGLVAAWAARRSAPINFVAPKEPVRQTDPETRRAIRIAAMAGALVLLLVLGGIWWVQSRKARLAELQAEEAQHDSDLTALGPDAKHIDALTDWTRARVSWRDELYDVTARMEQRKGFRLTEVNGQLNRPAAGRLAQDKSKDKYSSVLTLYGELPPGQDGLVERLKAGLTDEHHRAKATYPGSATKKDAKGFTLSVDVSPQPAQAYTATIAGPGTPPRPLAPKKKQGPPTKKQQAPEAVNYSDGGQP